jgi:predicted RNA-binding Zn-ribbon protein involved in translation (DUF1610 family)
MAKIMVEETPSVNINTLIDEAIAKKDRSVLIFISSVGTTIRVEPLCESTTLSWIDRSIKGTKYISDQSFYQCPECGHVSSYASTYCPNCGEKLRLPNNEEKEK